MLARPDPWDFARRRSRSLGYTFIIKIRTSVMKECLTPHRRDREGSLKGNIKGCSIIYRSTDLDFLWCSLLDEILSEATTVVVILYWPVTAHVAYGLTRLPVPLQVGGGPPH